MELKKEFYSYDRFKIASDYLYNSIINSAEKYDLLLCNLRGGFYLCDYLSRKLNIPYSVCHISERDSDKLNSENIISPFQIGKKYLFVDDLVDSGKTIDMIPKEYNVDVCVLLFNNKVLTDKKVIFHEIFNTGNWIDFFWEI